MKKLLTALLLSALMLSYSGVAVSDVSEPAVRSSDDYEDSYSVSDSSIDYGDDESLRGRAVSVNGSRELTYFKGIKNKNVGSYSRISVSIAGKPLSEVAYLINETTYIPLRAAMTLAGARVGFDNSTRTATVEMSGLYLTVKDGAYTMSANGRPLPTATPSVILSDGRMYVPIRSLAKALGLSVAWNPPASVDLSGSVSPLASAYDYYKADELYWLSRIISAEARGESLLGQIAVGNIVLNRMRSSDYPDTIYGVIFDRKYGVQFSPVRDGSIYNDPTYSATQAAKICLEGVSISPDILFFLNPTASSSSWIVLNRKYAFTVGNHYFFY